MAFIRVGTGDDDIIVRLNPAHIARTLVMPDGPAHYAVFVYLPGETTGHLLRDGLSRAAADALAADPELVNS